MFETHNSWTYRKPIKWYLCVLDDWFPRLYALLKNKKNLKEYVDTEDTYLFYDFVNIN